MPSEKLPRAVQDSSGDKDSDDRDITTGISTSSRSAYSGTTVLDTASYKDPRDQPSVASRRQFQPSWFSKAQSADGSQAHKALVFRGRPSPTLPRKRVSRRHSLTHHPQTRTYTSTPAGSNRDGANLPSSNDGWNPFHHLSPPQATRVQAAPIAGQKRRVDLVFDPSEASRDMIIRLSLPMHDDYDLELEEFCHLRRLGRFRDAEDYYKANLGHLDDNPYVLVQHAEALLCSGDYKSFSRLLGRPESSRIKFDCSRGGDNLHKIFINLELLELLSQPRFPPYAGSALTTAIQGLPNINDSSHRIGSAELQTLSLSLRLLRYCNEASYQASTAEMDRIRDLASGCYNWQNLYHELVGEERIWDFRDLFVSVIPVFGWQETIMMFLGLSSVPDALERIVEDWYCPVYDESSTLGLLDLFTSLILEQAGEPPSGRPRMMLLQHAKTLAARVREHNIQHMTTGPFIKFILANAVVEMEDAVKCHERTFAAHDGIPIWPAMGGVHLPIYVPFRHGDRPVWADFLWSSNPSQRTALNVAVQAADFTGDLALQAVAWKLLILQTENPRPFMDTLAHLQLDVQGDREGFLCTCLSKYLTVGGVEDERGLLQDFSKLDNASDGSYLNWGFHASLLWGRSMIQGFLEVTTANAAELGRRSFLEEEQDATKRCKDELSVYGPRLPETIERFLSRKFDITVPRATRVSFVNSEGQQGSHQAAKGQQRQAYAESGELVSEGEYGSDRVPEQWDGKQQESREEIRRLQRESGQSGNPAKEAMTRTRPHPKQRTSPIQTRGLSDWFRESEDISSTEPSGSGSSSPSSYDPPPPLGAGDFGFAERPPPRQVTAPQVHQYGEPSTSRVPSDATSKAPPRLPAPRNHVRMEYSVAQQQGQQQDNRPHSSLSKEYAELELAREKLKALRLANDQKEEQLRRLDGRKQEKRKAKESGKSEGTPPRLDASAAKWFSDDESGREE